MKTFLHKTTSYFALFLILATAELSGQTNSVPELVFQNSQYVSGSSSAAGRDGSVYRFPQVTTNVDALVRINGRSDSKVKLASIDVTSTGHGKAFQPEVSYNNGDVTSAVSWWMELQVSFVNEGESTPFNVEEFVITALDVDGDGNRLKEYLTFYGATSYILENNSLLQVGNVTGTIENGATPGKRFLAPSTNFVGIDTSSTQVMTTNTFTNKNSFIFRIGATTTGSTSAGSRLNSLWFKGFSYSTPVAIILPVKLKAFDAYLKAGSNAELKWVTSSEENTSHFILQRSKNGSDYTDIATVLAYGNSSTDRSYSFIDKNVDQLSAGILFYRLLSVDADGKGRYSDTRVIRLDTKALNSMTVSTYPNPVSSELRVTLPAGWQNKKVVYELYNANGLLAKRLEKANAAQTETLNVRDLSSGFYVVRVSCGGETAQQKVIKQ